MIFQRISKVISDPVDRSVIEVVRDPSDSFVDGARRLLAAPTEMEGCVA